MKTKMTLLIICMSFIASFQMTAQLPGFEWAGQMGGDSIIEVSSVAVDASGNQIFIGSYRGTADFDPNPNSTFYLSSVGWGDIFIQKLDADGNLLWAASIGDMNNDYGGDVVTDAAGNIYATGHFWGTTDVDPGEGVYYLSQNRWTTMVLKINPDGDLIWGKQMGSETAGHAYGRSIAIDNNLNVITSGTFYGRVDFDPGPAVVNLTCTSNDIFVQKLDPDGNFVWVKQLVGTEAKYANSTITDAAGDIYLCGYFKGIVDFNPDKKLKYNLTSSGDYDAFYLKLNSSGSFIWAKQIGGTESDGGYDMVMDASGNIYSTGAFYGTADFDPGSGVYYLTSNGQNDAFILKLNSSGGFAWAKKFGGTAYEAGFSIQMDASTNLYIGSFFYGTIDADPGTGTYYITSEGMDDALVQKLTSDGNLIWASQTGGAGWDYTLELALDGSGNIFNVGGFGQTVDMNPEGGDGYFLTNSDENNDMFVQKLNAAGGFNCPVPNGLTSANITETSADLSWSPVSDYTGNYNIRYREIGETWIISETMTGTSITLTALTPITAYEFQVRTACPSNYSYSSVFTTSGGCQDVYEPNETFATAYPIAANTDVYALLSPQYDIDHFSFSTTQTAKNVMIILSNLPADYNLYLYKSNETLLDYSINEELVNDTVIYNSTKIGSYIVRVVGPYGAYDPANCYTLHVTTSSTPKSATIDLNNKESNISIYPNPANELFNIEFVAQAKVAANLSIINTSGQQVYNNDLQVNEGINSMIVPVKYIKPGLYLVRLVTPEGVIIRKLLINH